MRSTLERMRQPRAGVGSTARHPAPIFPDNNHLAAAFQSGHRSFVSSGKISPLCRRVKRKSRVTLAENPVAPQRAELFGEIPGPAMLRNHLGLWRQEDSSAEQIENAFVLFRLSVRRID